MSLRHIGAALAAPLLFAAVHSAAADTPFGTWDKLDSVVQPGWKVPRTAWGDPDLRGNWPIDYLSPTPRVRPASFGTRAELTDEEYKAALASAQAQLETYGQEDKVGKMGMGHWTERGKPLRQASLLTYPLDGRLPAMTPEGERRAAQMKSSWTEEVFNWTQDFNLFDRCITRGLPGSMLPGAYNMGIEVWQAPGIVAIKLEMIHETRIVHLGESAPPPQIRNWLGYSVGHWEGDSLVIETTNFIPGSGYGNVGTSPKPVPNSDQQRMIERLTPTGPDTIQYEAWVDDPVVLTGPFKYSFPWRRNTDYVQYEYACHEGNEQFRGYIEGRGTNPRLVAKRAAAVASREAGQPVNLHPSNP
jgi:hypothetical protein